MRVRLNNYARELRQRSGDAYFQWRLFVDEPPDVLQRIEAVQYHLHPTFPQPLQVRTDPRDGFALDSAGWGEFTVQATIVFKDGHRERSAYYLDLGKAWPRATTGGG